MPEHVQKSADSGAAWSLPRLVMKKFGMSVPEQRHSQGPSKNNLKGKTLSNNRQKNYSRVAARAAAAVMTTAVAVSGASVALAAPQVISQPGTTPPPPAPAPVQANQQAPARAVTPAVAPAPAPVPAPVVRFVPGATQASQPIIVRNYVTNEIVYETSPGLALASPTGAVALNPGNVVATFERNVREEDRATMDAARGAAAAGAVVGGVAGGAGGALAGGALGAGAGLGAGVAICGATTAAIPVAPPVAPFAAACWAAGPAFVGPVLGGAVGAGAGVPVGATAGMLAGAQLGASVVPGGQAVMQRTIADTTWDLESQARVAQGAEPLAGEKPGDSMAGVEAPSAGSSEVIPSSSVAEFIPATAPSPAPVPAPVNQDEDAVQQVSAQVDAALNSAGIQAPAVPDLPTLPQIDLNTALPGLPTL